MELPSKKKLFSFAILLLITVSYFIHAWASANTSYDQAMFEKPSESEVKAVKPNLKREILINGSYVDISLLSDNHQVRNN